MYIFQKTLNITGIPGDNLEKKIYRISWLWLWPETPKYISSSKERGPGASRHRNSCIGKPKATPTPSSSVPLRSLRAGNKFLTFFLPPPPCSQKNKVSLPIHEGGGLLRKLLPLPPLLYPIMRQWTLYWRCFPRRKMRIHCTVPR